MANKITFPSGKVGIGTENPEQTLHIEGTLRLTGSTGTSTTLMGRDNIGNVSAITIGSGLNLSSNTLTATGGGTGTVTGSGTATQVAFWSGATGTTSTALSGSSSLYWDNVNSRLGVGTSTPTRQITTTTDIEVNGIRIGKGISDDDTNIYIYRSTVSSTNTATHNTILGANGGEDITSGGSNTLIGSNAGSNLTTGSSNVYIGRSASSGNLLASNNTVIGTLSFLNHTTGNLNVVIGSSAGRYLSNGITSLTSLSNSVFIGNLTKASTNGESNVIVIGDNSVSLGSNTTVLGYTGTTQTHLYGNLTLGSTNTPNARMVVTGSGNSNTTWTAQFHNNTGSNNGLMIRDDGNVGIGTDTPTSRLDVVGTVEFQNPNFTYDGGILGSELLSSSNWTTTGWTGTYASGFTHTVGNTNVLSNTLAAVIGYYYQIEYIVTNRTAGTFSISFGGESSVNVSATGVFGPQATSTNNLQIIPTSTFDGTIVISIKRITAGSATFVGKNQAGVITYEERYSVSNTNIFQGVETGRNNTTGVNNTFIGYQAGRGNTTGSQNIFLGFGAGYYNTVADLNTFIGYQTGYSNTIGYNNFFLGYRSGFSNTEGHTNLFQGNNSGYFNTTGYNNIFIGPSTGRNNTSGNNNILNGVSAAFSNTEGSKNIALGVDAGRYVAGGLTGNTRLDNSILIGFDARALASGQTNQIVIGYEGRGLGSNTTVIGNSSTTQTHLHGNLTLGSTTATGSRLTVTGGGFTTGTTSMLILNSTGGTNVTVNDGGNVGIGTSAPNERLTIIGQGNSNATTAFRVSNSSSLSMLSVRNDGVISVGQNLWYTYAGVTGTGAPVLTKGLFRLLYSDNGPNSYGYGLSIGNLNVANRDYTNGDGGVIGTTEGYAPTSGTGTFSVLYMLPTINQTGGATGITRGIRINPTLTNATDWRSIEWTNDTGYGLYGSGAAANYLKGNLSIGITTAAQTLHVAGTMRLTGSTGTGTTLMARDTNGDVSAVTVGSGLNLSNNTLTATGGGSGTVSGSGTATQVAFWDGATGTTSSSLTSSSNLYWDNENSRLGVGTNTPSKGLTIKANNADEGFLLRSANDLPLFQVTRDGTSNNTSELFQWSGGVIRFAIRSSSNTSYFNGGNFAFGSTIANARLQVLGGTIAASGWTAQFHNSGGTSNSLMIRDDGNVGIGTSGTTARLQVVSSNNADTTWTAQFHNNTGSNNALMIRDDGNVGIGTSTPTSNFDVVGTVEFQNPTTAYDGGILGSELLSSSNWTTTGWTGTYASGFTHTTGNTSVLSNTLAATVNKFYEVRYTITGRTAGSITISFGGQSIAGQASTNAFGPKATTTGNLQITPTSDFNGTVVMSVKEITSGTANIVYKDAGGEVTFEQLVSGTNNNFFQGVSSGRYNTIGINNIFQGYLTGSENTSGSNNIFQGANAGEKNTTGSWNVFQGRQTGRSNTTGSYNLFQGPLAGELNTTGDYNVFQGVGAGKNNTSGIANVFQGYNAGLANTIGNYNIAQGYYTLYQITSGSSNIAVGNFAAGSLTTGSDNIIQGTTAGFSTTSATGNIFIGRETAYENTVGAYNVAIGYRAGRYVAGGLTGNTRLDNSILIGFDARALASGQTNQVVIGYEGRGLGSNTTVIGNSSTTQTHLYGNLTLGSTTATGSRLTVTGAGFTTGTTSMLILNSTGGTNVTVNDGGNVGIGTISPSFSLEVVGQSRIGGNFDLATNTSFFVTGSRSDRRITNTSAGSITNSVGYFVGTVDMRGSQAFTACNGMSFSVNNQNTSAGNIITAGNFTVTNDASNAGLSRGIGVVGRFVNVSNVGANDIRCVQGDALNLLTGSTIDNLYLYRAEVGSNLGTITNTFGYYVGDITTGTQPNTPFSFYASDPNAFNYFAGNVGIGTTSPSQTLHVAGTMRLTGSTGTGTTLMARNAAGDVSAVTLSGGLSLSNNVLSGTSPIVPKAETPTGFVNGSNLVYTITTTPIANEGVIVFLNGIAQYNGIDYTVSGTTITFTNAPASGSSIFVYYFA